MRISAIGYQIKIHIWLRCDLMKQFNLFCPLLDKDNSIENVYIALSCPTK